MTFTKGGRKHRMLEVDSYSRTEAAFSVFSCKGKGNDSVYVHVRM